MAHWEFPEETALGYEDITLTRTGGVRGLTPPINPTTGAPSQTAFVQCQSDVARIRLDGGNPTATSGFMLAAGDAMILKSERVAGARFIASGNGTPLLSVHYFY